MNALRFGLYAALLILALAAVLLVSVSEFVTPPLLSLAELLR